MDQNSDGSNTVTWEQQIATLQGGLAGDETPDAIKSLDEGDANAQGKASHAYAEMKRKAREAADLARRAVEYAKKVKEESTQSPTAGAPKNVNAGGGTNQMIVALKAQAVKNLGMQSEADSPELVALEVQRLYNGYQAQLEQIERMKVLGPQVVAKVVDGIDLLTDEDKTAVKERCARLDPTQQCNEQAIRFMVSNYLGEKVLAGSGGQSGAGDGSGGEGTEGAAGNASAEDTGAQAGDGAGQQAQAGGSRAATVAGVKNGSPSVRPGKQNASTGPKPLTTAEREEMRKLGLNDPVAYRAAKEHKSRYT